MKLFKYGVIALAMVVALIGCGRKDRSASAYKIWGIDISRHQQKIDWDVVAEKNRPDFVYVKATEGLNIGDPAYRKHIQSLEKHGILWGAYHFFGHRTAGKDQARHFIRTAGLKKGNLMPVLDIEDHRFFKDPEKMVLEVNAFCEAIRAEYGVYPIIYASTHFYEKYLKKDFPENRYRIWIADYSNHPKTDWIFWQHTDAHNLHGITGGVDRNVFFGKADRLQQYVLR